mmetsp:Transcript_41079/g.112879  ORF Transcript_41079/g.112879 Transcript_41079/m.112879 type:complete len:251 (+) Transcript_41079:1780-2532(+)
MQHVGPHLEGRHLEQGEHRGANVVKVADVGVAPPARHRLVVRLWVEDADALGLDEYDLVVTRCRLTHHKLHAEEAVAKQHEEAHLEDVDALGHGAKERVDDLAQSREALDHPKGPQRAQHSHRAENTQALHVRSHQREERREHDGQVEDIPGRAKISRLALAEAERADLERHLECEERCEEDVGGVEELMEVRTLGHVGHVERERGGRHNDRAEDELVKPGRAQDGLQLAHGDAFLWAELHRDRLRPRRG